MSSSAVRPRAAWDPKSYLADAASEHVLSVDAKAAATTIVNYYEFIAAQLEEREVSQHILEQQALQMGTSASSSTTSGAAESSLRSSAASPPHEQVYVVRGVAMCVPFKVIVVVQHVATTTTSPDVPSPPLTPPRDEVQKVIEDLIQSVFREMHRIFGHHDASLLRSMDALDRIVIDNKHLINVLDCAVAMQNITGGIFTIQGLRLRRCIREAVRRGDGISADSVNARMDAFIHPSSPESKSHAQFLDAVADLSPDALYWECNDAVGDKQRHSSSSSSKVLVKRRGMPLDLDALSKGYCVDVMIETLQKIRFPQQRHSNDESAKTLGSGPYVSGVLVEWGGDVRVWGSPATPCKRPEESSDDAGRSSWVLGIVLPPRLDTLYHQWKENSDVGLGGHNDATSSLSDGNHALNLEHVVTLLPTTSTTSAVAEGSSPSEKEEASYLRAVRLWEGESSCAMATSGDYAQVERFGFTHTVDSKNRDLLRAQGHTIASSSVVASSAMLADAIATALMACGELSVALQLIGRVSNFWRGRGEGGEASCAEGGGGEEVLFPGGHMTQFYLYSRNHQELVHDEDDLVPGEGDVKRATLYANGQRSSEALHEIHQATTAQHHHESNPSLLPRPISAAALSPAVAAAAAAARKESSRVLLDNIRTMGTADAFHHTASLSFVPVASDDDDDTAVAGKPAQRPSSAVYSLSAAAGVASDHNAQEEHKLAVVKHLGRECIPHLEALIVFPSQAVSGLGRIVRSEKCDVGSALSIARMSSVVFLGVGNRIVVDSSPAVPPPLAARYRLSFNVMKGTPLFNAVVQALSADDTDGVVRGSVITAPPLVLHLRSSRVDDGFPEPISSLFRRDPKDWLHEKDTRSLTVELSPLDRISDRSNKSVLAAVSFSKVVEESDMSLLLLVQHAEVIGDHCVVLCEGSPLVPKPRLSSSSSSSNTFKQPTLPSLTFPLTPVVVAATHRAHGSVGFVGFGLRMCSARPLVVSVVFSHSVASQLLFPTTSSSTRGSSDLATPRIQICLLASNKAVERWFADDDFVYTPVPVAQLLPKKGSGEPNKGNVVAVLDCRLIEVIAPPSSLPLGDGSYHVLTASVSDVQVVLAGDEAWQSCFTELRAL
ncbi:Hypothetical protein, putative [Bodo saltans]|uniref:FAD:protein FMN transferase n=1 Tax=Bodo saltans TaxID=75058 RepID=A0A0S4J2F8_BODSA|nr:Hypothetical protein, putative [Bodo saltans]|eukprot:CUG58082.1 Hypothetical protein, putative [Bodo saltans]